MRFVRPGLVVDRMPVPVTMLRGVETAKVTAKAARRIGSIGRWSVACESENGADGAKLSRFCGRIV